VAALAHLEGAELLKPAVEPHPPTEQDLQGHLVSARIEDDVVEAARPRRIAVVVVRPPHPIAGNAHHNPLIAQPQPIGRQLIANVDVVEPNLLAPVDVRVARIRHDCGARGWFLAAIAHGADALGGRLVAVAGRARD
jgi:hypothetical protein